MKNESIDKKKMRVSDAVKILNEENENIDIEYRVSECGTFVRVAQTLRGCSATVSWCPDLKLVTE